MWAYFDFLSSGKISQSISCISLFIEGTLPHRYNVHISRLSISVRAHQSSSACVSSQPLWKPPGPWSRLGVPPSGKWLTGRCRSARRWRRSCCSLVKLRCPASCGLCSSPWNPVWKRYTIVFNAIICLFYWIPISFWGLPGVHTL